MAHTGNGPRVGYWHFAVQSGPTHTGLHDWGTCVDYLFHFTRITMERRNHTPWIFSQALIRKCHSWWVMWLRVERRSHCMLLGILESIPDDRATACCHIGGKQSTWKETMIQDSWLSQEAWNPQNWVHWALFPSIFLIATNTATFLCCGILCPFKKLINFLTENGKLHKSIAFITKQTKSQLAWDVV